MRDDRIDPVASLVAAYAEGLLRDLGAVNCEPSARCSVLSLGGWKVRVEVSPSPPEELVCGLNPCGRAVLALLWDAEGPISAEKVRDALEESKLIFGLITVQRALRLLHRQHKVVEHSRHWPRGYYLPQRLPLFRVKPRPESDADGDDNELDK